MKEKMNLWLIVWRELWTDVDNIFLISYFPHFFLTLCWQHGIKKQHELSCVWRWIGLEASCETGMMLYIRFIDKSDANACQSSCVPIFRLIFLLKQLDKGFLILSFLSFLRFKQNTLKFYLQGLTSFLTTFFLLFIIPWTYVVWVKGQHYCDINIPSAFATWIIFSYNHIKN